MERHLERVPGIEQSKRFLKNPWVYLVSVGGMALFMGGILADRIISNANASAWADKIRYKLQDPEHNLAPQDDFYPHATIVAAGRTWEEQQRMREEGTPINVRGGAKFVVIGQIAQDSEVFNVVVGEEWASFPCSTASGITFKPGVESRPDEVCNVAERFISPR